mmetsp:Transcript_6588/g.17841  ORF Transcript_6588/g.17841 Transcript_6588/m.17841 type:complete len:707 (-) Transcript_6588:24-2144(-)
MMRAAMLLLRLGRRRRWSGRLVSRRGWLRRLVDLLDLGAGAGAGALGTGTGTGTAKVGAGRGSTAGTLVHLGDDGVADALDLLELVLELVNLRGLVTVEPGDGLLDGSLDLSLVVGVELASDVLVVHGVLHVVGVVLEPVLGLNLLLVLLVLSLVLLSLLDHALNLLLGKAALVVGDGDLVLLAGGLVLGGDVEDTVGVDVEAHVDLGHAAGSGGDAGELKLAEEVVVLGPGALALEHLDEHTGLVVGVGGEDLLLLGGDGGVAGDEHGHHAADSLETHGEGGDVEEEEVLHLLVALTGEDGSLDGGAVGDSLVGVDGLAQLLAVEEVGEEGLHLGNAGGTADEDNLVDRVLVNLGVAEALLDGLHALAEEVHVELLKPGAGDGGVEVDTLEERVDLDGGLRGGGEGALGALARGAEAAEGAGVAGDVLLVLALEFLDEVVHEALVKVLTAEVGVTRGGLDLEDALLDGEEGDVKGTAAEVKDEHVALRAAVLVLLVEAVRDRRRGGLVDDAHAVDTRDHRGILGRLALGIVEVRRDGDDSVLDLLAEVRLGDLLHLDEDHRGDLLGAELLLFAVELDGDHGLVRLAGDDFVGPVLDVRLDLGVGELAADHALGVEDGVDGVHRGLVLGGITDETLGIGEGDVGRGGAVALVVGDDLDAVVLPDADAGVGGAEVDADGGTVNLSHDVLLCLSKGVWVANGGGRSRV